MAYGGFLRYVNDGWIVRADVDVNKTGNTFKGKFPYPYEAIDLKQTRFVLSGGRYFFKIFYALLGIGLTHNDGFIEQYPSNPYSYSFKDNILYSATLGVEKDITKDWFVFLEGCYIYQEMSVYVNGDNVLNEDTSNSNFFFGVGRGF